MHTYQIKKESHVISHFMNNKVLCVSRYSYSHSKARKLTRKMTKQGILKTVVSGDVFLVTMMGDK